MEGSLGSYLKVIAVMRGDKRERDKEKADEDHVRD